ncbi:ras-related protein Rab-24-like isoform X2 [Venturia canescens]|uniref:ras-related protein Rab-24-like isoform X2 n=1 Tax=Venturia canescens TaxID=32260 RepID=UPI001C9C7168|nr:ras-related protein Rab-24-like isoform X2 [Venturia canescens]
MPPPPELKVVLLGDNCVGKTCLAHRFVTDTFISPSESETTIGAVSVSKEVRVSNKKIKLGVWDTAGDERYDAMTKFYYRGANASEKKKKKKTSEKVKYWINELKSVEEGCSIYVCALKKDLLRFTERDMVRHLEHMENYADEVPAKFYITSSKTGQNVELFQAIAETCVPTVKNPHTQKLSDQFDTLSLDNKNPCYV